MSDNEYATISGKFHQGFRNKLSIFIFFVGLLMILVSLYFVSTKHQGTPLLLLAAMFLAGLAIIIVAGPQQFVQSTCPNCNENIRIKLTRKMHRGFVMVCSCKHCTSPFNMIVDPPALKP